MADRVKPDGWAPVLVPAPEYIDADTGVVYSGRYVDEATFARSTILRVIDEVFTDARIEYGPPPSDLRSALEHYRFGAFDALTDLHEALRARFEEVDDG